MAREIPGDHVEEDANEHGGITGMPVYELPRASGRDAPPHEQLLHPDMIPAKLTNPPGESFDTPEG